MQLFSREKAHNNKERVEQIILAKYNQYYRLAYNYVHNEADACDIVQNGAYKALRSSDTLQNPEFAETWIYRIMLNECFRYFKQTQPLSYETVFEEETKAEYSKDSETSIDLQRALDTLPKKEKAIVVLKYFEDKTLEEIATILDENVNTVKSKLYRSIKKLRGVLSDGENMQDYKISNGKDI